MSKLECVKNFAWNQMDAMWHDDSGLSTLNMIKFYYKGYVVVNPWMDEKTRKSVNPYKYYGKKRTKKFIKQVLQEMRRQGINRSETRKKSK